MRTRIGQISVPIYKERYMDKFKEALQKAKDEIKLVDVKINEAIGMLRKITYKNKTTPNDMKELRKILAILEGE